VSENEYAYTGQQPTANSKRGHMRTTSIGDFKLEVEAQDGVPHVRVSFANGEVVLETNRVSVTGLQKMPDVFEAAASMAFDELEHYYHRLHVQRDRTG
jgi:hypothetical protein